MSELEQKEEKRKKKKKQLVVLETEVESELEELVEVLEELEKEKKYMDIQICPHCKSPKVRRVKSMEGDVMGLCHPSGDISHATIFFEIEKATSFLTPGVFELPVSGDLSRNPTSHDRVLQLIYLISCLKTQIELTSTFFCKKRFLELNLLPIYAIVQKSYFPMLCHQFIFTFLKSINAIIVYIVIAKKEGENGFTCQPHA